MHDPHMRPFLLPSRHHPGQVLKEMARVCKPGGKILLLEHGRGSWGWINRSLDQGAERHYKSWGCMWNRPILELVKEVCVRVRPWRPGCVGGGALAAGTLLVGRLTPCPARLHGPVCGGCCGAGCACQA